jgi:hypothetical protein
MITVLPTPIVVPEVALSLEPMADAAGMSIASGKSLYFSNSAARQFTAEEIDAINQRRALICVFARVTYDDTFGESHIEEAAAYVGADSETLAKLTSNYVPSDLSVTFYRIEGYSGST